MLRAYLAGIDSPEQRANNRAALECSMTLNGGPRKTRAEHAVSLYDAGYRVRLVKDKYRLVAPNGTFFEERSVTKALCNFVVYLTEAYAERRYIEAMQKDTRLD